MGNLRDKQVLVVGFGKSGASAARFLVGEGAKVTVTDRKPREALQVFVDACRDLPVTYELGEHRLESFTNADLIVLSPGVPRASAEIQAALHANVPITNEPSLAFERIRQPVIAVTGSAGKTTTCTLLARMLEAGGKKVFLGGNIGKPLLDLVMSGQDVDYVVAELSSFQLETLKPFVPHVVIFTPIAQDHLDRYPGMDEYVEAKRVLARYAEPTSTVIVSRDNPWHRRFEAGTLATVMHYSKQPPSAEENYLGAFYRRAEKEIVIGEGHLSMKSCPAGEKNTENIMAAAIAAAVSGVGLGAVQEVIDGFRGIAHRLEFVRDREGVLFFNDSKATNVISVLNALAQFDDGSVVLLAGGKNKAIDFTPLRDTAQRKCRLVVTFGESGEAMAQTLSTVVPVVRAGKFQEAVEKASREAKRGDNVVLSPACASHDQFKSYEERGDLFKQLVQAL